MMDREFLEGLRKIRSMETLNLKPSMYLRERYMDEYGVEGRVVLREYQKKHIFEMLQVTRHLCGSDAGLGKTLQVLSTIGYVWMKEPEYVPIVLAKKSALHQWSIEVNKFMQNMEDVTVDDNPYNRNDVYTDFFHNYNVDKKRLLIMTYDMLLKDAKEAVIRDSSHKATAKEKKILSEARGLFEKARKASAIEFEDLTSYFNKRPYEVWDHAKIISAVGAEPRNPPDSWTDEDDRVVKKYVSLLNIEHGIMKEVFDLESKICPTVVVPGLMSHITEFKKQHPEAKFMLVMDEAHTVKNHKGKIHEAVANLAKCCHRVYGLTATPVKNRLMEFYSLFRIIVPGLFPKISWFQNEYCVTKLQRIGGGRSVPIVVGYRNLDKFVQDIEPYYLAKRKHEVAAELPRLVTRELKCELTDLQEELYDMAEAGLLEKDSDPDSSSAAILGAMTYVQEAVDAPNLLNDQDGEPYVGDSPKIDTLLELLENELDGTKTIIFSRFERMISLIEDTLKKKEIKCVRITGKENKASHRERAKSLFQNKDSGVNVILITEAGSESINLQAAEHFVLVDSPWSFGTYTQLIGRMIRIGSSHQMVVATHLMAVRQNGNKTIDHYVIKKLKSKKALVDKVAGEGLKDGLEFVPEDDAMEIVSMIKQGREIPKKALPMQKRNKVKTKGLGKSEVPSCQKRDREEDDPSTGYIDVQDLEI